MKARPQNSGSTEELSKANKASLVAYGKTPLKETHFLPLLQVIAETLDTAAAGTNAWISIGKNQNGDAFLLTYHEGSYKLYAGGHSLLALANDCLNILETP